MCKLVFVGSKISGFAPYQPQTLRETEKSSGFAPYQPQTLRETEKSSGFAPYQPQTPRGKIEKISCFVSYGGN